MNCSIFSHVLILADDVIRYSLNFIWNCLNPWPRLPAPYCHTLPLPKCSTLLFFILFHFTSTLKTYCFCLSACMLISSSSFCKCFGWNLATINYKALDRFFPPFYISLFALYYLQITFSKFYYRGHKMKVFFLVAKKCDLQWNIPKHQVLCCYCIVIVIAL